MRTRNVRDVGDRLLVVRRLRFSSFNGPPDGLDPEGDLLIGLLVPRTVLHHTAVSAAVHAAPRDVVWCSK